MHIAFRFHYIHDNGLFGRLLQEVGKHSRLPLNLYQEKHEYVLAASGDQPELEALADLVSTYVPQSLFLQGYTLTEYGTPHEPQLLAETKTHYQVPCCPQCQQKITQTLDPFEPCFVCGFNDTLLTLEDLRTFTQTDTLSAEELFITLAEKLIAEESITLPTYNGIRRFSLLQCEEAKESGILICDPVHISASWLITQGELDALMTIEKPSVRLKPKLKFRAEFDLTKPFYPVFFADDKVTLALSTALLRKGVEAVYCNHPPLLRVASALKHPVIVTAGRDMLPWHHPMLLTQASCCSFEGFEASGGQNGLVVDTVAKPVTSGCVRFVAKGEPSSSPHPIFFEPSHAVLRSIVLEHGLQGQSLCGIYLSRTHRSQICSFSAKIGYTPMADFSDVSLASPKRMLTSISRMDEAGARLIANYQKVFPKQFEKIEQARFEGEGDASMLIRLWAMAALFIGLCDGDSIQNGCEQLEATALEFNGKSGPRIDYKVLKSENGYQIDPRLAIRSAMSFKLAGVDEYLLSYGFIDSLADFIAQQAELADANISIEGVTLGGSLFENRQLLRCTYNALSPNYPVFHNERLSMDGANVAVGAVSLGSE
ncbi:hypothetical protein [Sulfuricurvum sp.]|uniref:Kae1-like domain-containing protein n=1 Tax=Sulfuricurvum sp. TaxID=2025608 RepID=UPI003C44245D